MQQIGFLGCGNMGGAILEGALQSGQLEAAQVIVFDISAAAMQRMAALGVRLAANREEVCRAADMIVAAVKPQYAEATLGGMADAFVGKCLLSIMAGVSSNRLREMTGGGARVLRCMPNTPAMVLEGAFALCADSDATAEEKALAEDIFAAQGIVEWIPERLIDAVCGLSGGGPAYAAMFVEALADGGVMEGLPRQTAYRLAAQTLLGTAKMLLQKGMHPGELKDMVTSPGGTTIEGCLALEEGGLRAAVMQCVRAGAEKSRKL